MQINDDYRIESDPLNVILQRRVIMKNSDGTVKGERWEAAGFYSSCEAALQDLVRREIFGTGMDNYKKVCAKVAELNKLIKGLKIKEGYK